MSLSSHPSRSLFENSDDQTVGTENSGENDLFQTNEISPAKQSSYVVADAFSRELSRLQEEQITYLKKTEREKVRKEYLDANIEEAKLKLRSIQDKTKNGNIVKDHEVMNKKLMGRLEHQLQMAKIKLSTAKNENINLKGRVQDSRREKLLHLQILNDLLKEITSAKRRSKFCQKELTNINEKKHKVKVGIASIKQKMVRDMEEFSQELMKAKQSINTTQVNIMSTIRDKLQQSSVIPPFESSGYELGSTFTGKRVSTSPKLQGNNSEFEASINLGGNSTSPSKYRYEVPNSPSTTHGHTHHHHSHHFNAIGHNAHEAEVLLKETEFSSVEELLVALQHSEETVFALYHETQSKHEEVEKMELENKYLESKVQDQMKKLHELEGNQEQVKQELEKNIQSLKTMISKYDADYMKNMEVLKSIAENIQNLLKNVAVDEAALDQQLLSTGITDRNVGEFLGLIEQRIDDLIQMMKAANHQTLRKEDFLKNSGGERNNSFQPPVPPNLLEMDEDDDFDESTKLQPLNIPILKEIMHKKVQKMSLLPVFLSTNAKGKPDLNASTLNNNNSKLQMQLASKMGQSSSSLRSMESNKSLDN